MLVHCSREYWNYSDLAAELGFETPTIRALACQSGAVPIPLPRPYQAGTYFDAEGRALILAAYREKYLPFGRRRRRAEAPAA